MKEMISELKKGGRKANATLLAMVIVSIVFLMQFPLITTLMVLDYKEICFDMTYVGMFPKMSTAEYLAGIVTLIGLYNSANAYTYKKVTDDK